MHEIEALDYEIVAGHHRYKDTDPPTDLNAVDMNAVYISMLNFILDSGVDLAVDGATDITEGFVRFTKAVKRASNKVSVSVFNMASASVGLNPDQDIQGYYITEAASYPNGTIILGTSTSHDKRKVLFLNKTTTTKVIDGSGCIAKVAPGCAREFWARNEGGFCVWRPTDGGQSGTFVVELRGSIAGLIQSGTCEWSIEGGRVFFTFPVLSGVGLAAQDLTLTAASGAGFPSQFDSLLAVGLFSAPCIVQNAGTTVSGYVYFGGAAGSRILHISLYAGGTFSGTCQILPLSMNYTIL